MWAKTADGTRNRNHPKPVPLTEAEREAAKPKREPTDGPMPVLEMLTFLGWSKPEPN